MRRGEGEKLPLEIPFTLVRREPMPSRTRADLPPSSPRRAQASPSDPPPRAVLSKRRSTVRDCFDDGRSRQSTCLSSSPFSWRYASLGDEPPLPSVSILHGILRCAIRSLLKLRLGAGVGGKAPRELATELGRLLFVDGSSFPFLNNPPPPLLSDDVEDGGPLAPDLRGDEGFAGHVGQTKRDPAAAKGEGAWGFHSPPPAQLLPAAASAGSTPGGGPATPAPPARPRRALIATPPSPETEPPAPSAPPTPHWDPDFEDGGEDPFAGVGSAAARDRSGARRRHGAPPSPPDPPSAAAALDDTPVRPAASSFEVRSVHCLLKMSPPPVIFACAHARG